MAKVIDANLIIRFLLNDNPAQAQAAQTLFESSQKLILVDLTLAEVVWVLISVYDFPKSDVVHKIQSFLKLNIVAPNKKLLIRSLILYRKYNISFADAYLAAFSNEKRLEGIYSFDRGLGKVKEIKRFEPETVDLA